jgi:hypothetical protein
VQIENMPKNVNIEIYRTYILRRFYAGVEPGMLRKPFEDFLEWDGECCVLSKFRLQTEEVSEGGERWQEQTA